jgi:hypothetical protein
VILSNKTEYRFFVKIIIHKTRCSPADKVEYFRNDMTLEFYNKWEWYFNYRAALLKVQNPKLYVNYEHGVYNYILPEEQYKEKVKNKYISSKRQITIYEKRIKAITGKWNELFPIEDHPDWKKVTAKLDYYKQEFENIKTEYNLIFTK